MAITPTAAASPQTTGAARRLISQRPAVVVAPAGDIDDRSDRIGMGLAMRSGAHSMVRRSPSPVVAAVIACVVISTASQPAAADSGRAHALYIELLGKGGLWGVGYDGRITHRFSLGGVASAYMLEDQRVVSLSPYAAVALAQSAGHAWFMHLGPQFAHVWAASPVPEWDGQSDTGVAGAVSTGYEYRQRVVIRVFAQAVAGKGGVAPWLGVSLGWEF